MAAPDGSLEFLTALGAAWRGDWSEFDGRTLRDQLGHVDALIRKECAGEDVRAHVASAYVLYGICPSCQSWTMHCRCGEADRAV